MAPMLLDRHRVTERVHGIEDQQIGVPVELDKWIGLVEAIIFVLAIGRIDDGLGSLGKAIRIRITRVKLLHRSHRKTGDLANLAGFEGHELDRRGERAKSTGNQGAECWVPSASSSAWWPPKMRIRFPGM